MQTPSDEAYMRRCFELARLGGGFVSPNPMVGAVLVHEGRIIGEGYHQQYGSHHAEVNAVRSVAPEDRHLLQAATLYVSLEPCCIHGNTPPCTDLIRREGIPRVVVSVLDLSPEVAGKGIRLLRESGINVTTGILEAEGRMVSIFRNFLVSQLRPYVILKYAQTQTGLIGRRDVPIWITSSYAKRLVHKWRKEIDGILIGTRTAEIDNPQLTNRFFRGRSPRRIVLDRQGRLSPDLAIFQGPGRTIVVTEAADRSEYQNAEIWAMPFDDNLLPQLLHNLAEQKISSLLVEGGRFTLQRFIDLQLWDEARVFTGAIDIDDGVPAPQLRLAKRRQHLQLGPDTLDIYQPDIHTR
ncbi:MAG: bifunctional diaminohydroxyphosphoribosylaminopyrimidine deaminase/5-amino-6-(5-phosphoribosylamino)uracil reductase RibD [Phaeodactylibacter sp.]|nr:bifunctional diaminohydroxyphosphoribosylaminopyrimidine deaminase/5-amino-6-(5-phosphoribosylamino)uracil reductase RibD [Phaeodactylibacter sp.]